MSYLMILYIGIAAVVLHGMCRCSEIKNWVKSILRVSLSPPKTSEDDRVTGRQERWSGSREKVSSGESPRKGAHAKIPRSENREVLGPITQTPQKRRDVSLL